MSAGPQKDAGVREQLERVLASATFRQVDRLKRFLSFIVTEAIAVRGDQLKEYVIGVHVGAALRLTLRIRVDAVRAGPD